MRVGELLLERPPVGDGARPGEWQRQVTVQLVMGLRLVPLQGESGGEVGLRPGEKRVDRERPARPVDRLIVLPQREIVRRFAPIPIKQIDIERADPDRLIIALQRLVELAERRVGQAEIRRGVDRGRIQGERALILGDRFGVALLAVKDRGFQEVSEAAHRIGDKRAGYQLVGFLEVGRGVVAHAEQGRK